MAQEQTIEAARARIQRLVDEIAALSKKELRSEDYFSQYLARVVQATDAKGGAVWLVSQRAADGKSEFQLAAEVAFDSSLFQSDEQQRTAILRVLGEVAASKQPMVLSPENAQPAPEPGSLRAEVEQLQPPAPPASGNRTPYPFLHVPLFLKEQVLGVLQVWLQPYVTPQNYAEFATFLATLGAHVEQHLQSRRLGSMVLENNRLQHVLKFANDLAGSLDSLEVARLSATYGRDLIGCERCSVLTLHGDRWQVLSIAGQEVVEKKSSMVKAMAAFVGAHARPEVVTLSKKELLARAEAQTNGAETNGAAMTAAEVDGKALALRRTDEIDLAYFQLSHVVSAAVAPLLDHDKQLVGAYFAESTVEGFFDSSPGAKEASSALRLTEFLATHTGRTLLAAQDYQTLPFLAVTKRLRAARLALTGRHKGRVLSKALLIAGVLLAISLYPKMNSVNGACAISPMRRSSIVPEVPGRVEKVLVREGTHLKKGDPIAELDKRRLETELATNEQERLRLVAESERYRGGQGGQTDEASAQVAMLQARIAEQNAKKIQADLEAATLRAPIDGVILSKDLELHSGEPIQPGVIFAEMAGLEDWEVQIEVPEKQIGKVEAVLAKRGAHVSFILYSQSAHKLHTRLERHEQISAAAYPRDKENVFVVTIQNLEIPAELKPALRPGLTGRGTIELGRQPLILLWTRGIWDWVRLRWIG